MMESRIYPDGPNRKSLKKILNNDRKIVSNIILKSTNKVLSEQYGFDETELEIFQKKVQSEINKM
ncbi:hypothetical protein OCO53_25375 [Peribacillus frigoritolerans]|uniref:hypothetical protein n=1 Tax=Peribacillus frigoritolerans TaxID=450367 RepID=UPI0021D0317D|nr:hypothetical protein [Peribacillus frigoritolerans]MCU6603775.1 hypothetical protein [Peribacillus frigoritolerans]